ncbi:hypothetical protein D7M11_16580 [Paenibacillus ginsengarvi]|uniref:Uncharacterized protein n=1 Tax=Paenibacillus ginsengarvi TaxID=400777 RepID=A0A3B0CEK4_9BACL|nr:hypothetical protein D7M11_16580 [Paenibacillus ginsengarvi]
MQDGCSISASLAMYRQIGTRNILRKARPSIKGRVFLLLSYKRRNARDYFPENIVDCSVRRISAWERKKRGHYDRA